MIKIKIKQVTYERLETDPHGYNNTRIGMVADVDKTENPIDVINELRMLVDGRLNAYIEVREAKLQIIRLDNRISHMKDNLHQIKLDDNQVERRDRLQNNISTNEVELQKLRKKVHDIIG